MANKNFSFWDSYIKLFSGVNKAYEECKNNEIAKEKIDIFAKRSIFYSVLFGVLGILGEVIVWASVKNLASKNIWLILTAVIGSYLIIQWLFFIPVSINLLVKQLKLNKKKIAIFALIILIVFIVAQIALGIVFFH